MIEELESEGWIFILLSHPEKEPIHLTNQPAPRGFVHLAMDGSKQAVIFTMIGKRDSEKVAFYVYGSWDFGDEATFFMRD